MVDKKLIFIQQSSHWCHTYALDKYIFYLPEILKVLSWISSGFYSAAVSTLEIKEFSVFGPVFLRAEAEQQQKWVSNHEKL